MSKLRAWIVVGVAILVSAVAAPVRAAPADADAVYGALRVNSVPADYVVMVDVSGSMNGPRYAQVRRSLSAFLAALAPDDQVTLVPFAEKPRSARTSAAGRSATQLMRQLPTVADGQSTDIGAALEKSVDVLSRSGAPAVATVVLLTDGEHRPPGASPYPFTTGYQWNVLAQRARKLRKASLQAFAVPLSADTGAPLLAKVFPGARTLRITGIDRLTAALDQPKREARAAKARGLLAEDARRGLTVQWPAGPIGHGHTSFPVRLVSANRYVPLTVERLAVTSGHAGVRVSVPDTAITVPAGGSVTVPIEVGWDAGPLHFAPLATVRDTAALSLSGQVGSPWTPVIAGELGLPFAPGLSPAGHDAELSAQRGSVVRWVVGLALLIALVLIARWGRRQRLRPALSGRLVVRAGERERVLTLSGRGVTLTAGTAGVPGAGTVVAVRSSLGSSVDLRITYSPDGSEGRRESHDCGPGDTVEIGGVRFTWRDSTAVAVHR
ncbi:VWA domain-containing protein [Actinoplanes bogorensis]|uniref:VWA domain-containing protein n=1 Tax=Paractinoplanes bogorensis TaxID=1610840 RepID=A0ABS5YYS4_9ACTN|nr:vWA domain-containing protein [Actinoplanes bogorensis]MBU2668241.1 VWA domain-containing protein [Actinoplanes bogorensis]